MASVDGRDIDDAAAAPALHAGYRRPAARVQAFQRDRELALQLDPAEHLERRRADIIDRIVDQDVDAAELGCRRLDQRLDLALLADIRTERQGPATGRLDVGHDRPRIRLAAEIVHHHPSTVHRKELGRGLADAAAGACDDHHLAGEPEAGVVGLDLGRRRHPSRRRIDQGADLAIGDAGIALNDPGRRNQRLARRRDLADPALEHRVTSRLEIAAEVEREAREGRIPARQPHPHQGREQQCRREVRADRKPGLEPGEPADGVERCSAHPKRQGLDRVDERLGPAHPLGHRCRQQAGTIPGHRHARCLERQATTRRHDPRPVPNRRPQRLERHQPLGRRAEGDRLAQPLGRGAEGDRQTKRRVERDGGFEPTLQLTKAHAPIRKPPLQEGQMRHRHHAVRHPPAIAAAPGEGRVHVQGVAVAGQGGEGLHHGGVDVEGLADLGHASPHCFGDL